MYRKKFSVYIPEFEDENFKVQTTASLIFKTNLFGGQWYFCEWITLFGGECCQIDSYFFLLFFWQFLRDISINKHIYQKKNIGQYIVTEYLFG